MKNNNCINYIILLACLFSACSSKTQRQLDIEYIKENNLAGIWSNPSNEIILVISDSADFVSIYANPIMSYVGYRNEIAALKDTANAVLAKTSHFEFEKNTVKHILKLSEQDSTAYFKKYPITNTKINMFIPTIRRNLMNNYNKNGDTEKLLQDKHWQLYFPEKDEYIILIPTRNKISPNITSLNIYKLVPTDTVYKDKKKYIDMMSVPSGIGFARYEIISFNNNYLLTIQTISNEIPSKYFWINEITHSTLSGFELLGDGNMKEIVFNSYRDILFDRNSNYLDNIFDTTFLETFEQRKFFFKPMELSIQKDLFNAPYQYVQ